MLILVNNVKVLGILWKVVMFKFFIVFVDKIVINEMLN